MLLFSVVAHEYAHGYVAFRSGDMTAYQLGRLTWNPLKHIDPFMSVLLPTLLALAHLPILGGAKPVPVNPRNYRNFKRADIAVSLAGIVMNLFLAVACTLVIPLTYGVAQLLPATINAMAIVQQMLVIGILINLQLAAFNLLPIPPLDGSHVFKYILPPGWALAYSRVGGYGLVVLYAVLFVGSGLLIWWLTPAFLLADLLRNAVKLFLLPWPYPA